MTNKEAPEWPEWIKTHVRKLHREMLEENAHVALAIADTFRDIDMRSNNGETQDDQ